MLSRVSNARSDPEEFDKGTGMPTVGVDARENSCEMLSKLFLNKAWSRSEPRERDRFSRVTCRQGGTLILASLGSVTDMKRKRSAVSAGLPKDTAIHERKSEIIWTQDYPGCAYPVSTLSQQSYIK